MDRVYIISRYRAETKKEQAFNIAVARYFCRMIIEECKVPVASHLYYTQFLDDEIPEDREAGLGLGIWELRNCKEFLLVVIDGKVSEGMRGEIEEAARLGLYGRIVSMTEQEIKDAMKVIK